MKQESTIDPQKFHRLSCGQTEPHTAARTEPRPTMPGLPGFAVAVRKGFEGLYGLVGNRLWLLVYAGYVSNFGNAEFI
jgi:hypothetical protein